MKSQTIVTIDTHNTHTGRYRTVTDALRKLEFGSSQYHTRETRFGTVVDAISVIVKAEVGEVELLLSDLPFRAGTVTLREWQPD